MKKQMNKKQSKRETVISRERRRRHRASSGAGRRVAKRDHTAQILPQGQEVQQASRARQDEAHSFTATVTPPSRGVGVGHPPHTPLTYPLHIYPLQGTTDESELVLQRRAWHIPPPPPLGVLSLSPPHKYLSVFGV